jgi:hypothetical protein
LESLFNGECTTNSPITDLSQGKIPKELTESFSQDQSTAKRLSKNHTIKSLLIIKPAAKALPSSGDLLGKTLFCYLLRIF